MESGNQVPEAEVVKTKPSFLENLKKYKPLFSRARRFTKRIPVHYILVLALVVAAYYIGNLRSEVNYLKKQATAASRVAGSASDQGNTKPTGKVPEVTGQDHIRGDRDAGVLLVEYSDLECPFCKRFHPTMQQILADYKGDVAWVYRHYPLNFHANAQKEAEAAECAGELGGNDKFWQYVDEIFDRTTSNGTGFALEKLAPLAAEIGLDQVKFKECLDSGKYEQQVKDEAQAGIAAGVAGTPGTFAVKKDGSSKLISGALPIEQLKQSIDEVLKK